VTPEKVQEILKQCVRACVYILKMKLQRISYNLSILLVTPEKVQEILQNCLEGGYLNLSNLKAILSGKARSGKSHTKARLFNMEPPSIPASTGVAEGAVRGSTGVVMAGVRDISYDVIQAGLDEWFQMSPKKMKGLLARAIREAPGMKHDLQEAQTRSMTGRMRQSLSYEGDV